MKIEIIFTKRKYEKQNFWDLVYEWEDVLSQCLNIKIKNEPKVFDKILKGIPYLYYSQTKHHYSLCFQMGAEIVPSKIQWLQRVMGLRAKNTSRVIPCIIDFWQPENEIPMFNKAYCNNPIVLISSMEAYSFLKHHGCKANIVHWALSLPDKYAITANTNLKKHYDLAMMGRQNALLEEFLKKYIETHPDFTYAYKKIENGHFNYYTNKGDYIGNADTREGYFNIMRGARCGLYATPGLDGKPGSNGYNQVTPRFLELLSSGCHILARYPDNEDTRFFGISRFSPSLDNYEDFEKALDRGRKIPVDMNVYSEYLSLHYTSVRAKELEQIINKK